MTDDSQTRQPRDTELFEAVRAFVLEARTQYLKYRDSASYVIKIHDRQEFDEFESGFPHITRDLTSEVADYRRPFGSKKTKWTPISFGEWESFERLMEIADRHERLQATSLIDPAKRHEGRGKDFWEIEVSDLPLEVFDRLMHVHGEEFECDQLTAVYCQLEEGILAEKLPIMFAVPILLTKFADIEVFPISSDMAVIEMSKKMHLARVPRHGRPTSSVNEVVSNAATHMLILTGWEMPNSRGHRTAPYDRMDWYPVERIDRFFDSLRLTTGVDTGYAEIFIIPEGQQWAYRFREDLPVVVRGASARRYPSHFDDFGWLVDREPITEDQLTEVIEVYAGLADSDSLGLAARRLSTGMLREDEDDAILDLLIGLEAMLSDRERGELTFKLAVRTAAVLAGLRGYDPSMVFGQVKQLYSYRSAVAHGDAKKAAKLRMLNVNDDEVSSISLATSFLRDVARQLVKRPDLATPGDIDSKLILRSFARAEEAEVDPGSISGELAAEEAESKT